MKEERSTAARKKLVGECRENVLKKVLLSPFGTELFGLPVWEDL